MLATRIKCVRAKQQLQKKQLQRYEQCIKRSNSQKEKQELQFPISKLKTYIYLSFLWIKKCMHSISQLYKTTSRMLETSHLLSLEGICDLTRNENISLLHDVNTIGEFAEIGNTPRITKQGSEQWKLNRQASLVTGSTLYSALGFRGIAKAKAHFRKFVLKQDDVEYSAEALQRMKYGSENEVCSYSSLQQCSTTQS